jgi:GNAT superfamily N-acetyltransferase
VKLWNTANLGRGAAVGFNCDWFDSLVLSQPYFDRAGLIVACDGGRDAVVGFVHAGFGATDDGSRLDRTRGVVCAIVVAPEHRRKGIGTLLLRAAETYLSTSGATEITAGERMPLNPFYMGIYGSSESAGFLESDPAAGPFLASRGYAAAGEFVVMERDLGAGRDPFDPRLMLIRRKFDTTVLDNPSRVSWWWMTRQARLDAFCCALIPKTGGAPVAELTLWGMELHSSARNHRTVGLVDLLVAESERRKGIARALLIDAMKWLRTERVDHVEVVVPRSDPATMKLMQSVGFAPVDTGVVFRRTAGA